MDIYPMNVGIAWDFGSGEQSSDVPSMPRPCAVVIHVRSYDQQTTMRLRCHGLAPWSIPAWLAASR